MGDHDWIGEMSDSIREAQARAAEAADKQRVEDARFKPLFDDYLAQLMNAANEIVQIFNERIPNRKASAERHGNSVTFSVAATGMTFEFSPTQKHVYIHRFHGNSKGSGGGPHFTEANGQLLLDDKTPSQFANHVFKEIAARAVGE